MFEIKKKKFSETEYGVEDFLDNWPVLYMLEGGKRLYIGQSNRFNLRMKEHKKDSKKAFANIIRLIYSEEFNVSATLDFESKLIQYIFADKKYTIINENSGIVNRDYYNKEYYDNLFYELWRELQKERIVEHNIEDILNSDFFKYSPYKELTDEQASSVTKIIERLKQDDKSTLMVKGMPGSGKTIICTFLMKYFKELEDFKDKKVGLMIPQESLRATLQKLFSKIDEMKREDVIGPNDVVKETYDILIVDEAHRLTKRQNIVNYGEFDKVNNLLGLGKEGDQMDWIMKSSKSQIFFYDALQVIGPAGIEDSRVRKKMERYKRLSSYARPFHLYSQMRVQGGKPYIDYIVQLLTGKVKEKKVVKNYEFVVVEEFRKFNELLYEKEQKNQLCRMAAGFAWRWISKKDKTKFDIEIDGIKKQWNHTRKNWVHREGAINQVGCIHSVQGYDLNYAFIILGNDIKYVDGQVVADSQNYFDTNGKNKTNPETLTEYIRNIYYVLLTRGIKGTYLYICDEGLRNYFEQYVDVII